MENIKIVLLSNRFKSFYWRTGMMVVAAFLNLVVENISGFGFNPATTVVVGLIFGEISKAIANVSQGKEV